MGKVEQLLKISPYSPKKVNEEKYYMKRSEIDHLHHMERNMISGIPAVNKNQIFCSWECAKLYVTTYVPKIHHMNLYTLIDVSAEYKVVN